MPNTKTSHSEFSISSVLLLLLASFMFMLMRPQVTEAVECTTCEAKWNKSFSVDLYYDTPDNRLRGWLLGLRNPNITIKYRARVRNLDTGLLIPQNGATIPVGTTFKIEHVGAFSKDITWVGTGYFSDSPIGHWVPKAVRNTSSCRSSDLFLKNYFVNILRGRVNTYVPFNVNPPSKSVSVTSDVVADLGGGTYKVVGEGSITANALIGSTYGKFYLLWQDGGCYDTYKAMRKRGASSAYVVSVPAKSIKFTFTAEIPNEPPSAPTITGPDQTFDGLTETFTFTATDPDDDFVRYQVDWDNNGSVNETIPDDGSYVASGNDVDGVQDWSEPGTYTFQVRAEDNRGGLSDWTSHTIEVKQSVVISNCSASPNPVEMGAPVVWSADVTDGTAPYTYVWTGSDGVSGTESTVSQTYYDHGLKGANLTVTDANGSTETKDCEALVVNVPYNEPPSKPLINGPIKGAPNTNHNFSVVAIDPDHNDITYGIDWDDDMVVDAWTATVPSGTSELFSQSWPALGTYTFNVVAEDEHYLRSEWASHTIEIKNGMTGYIDADPDPTDPADPNTTIDWGSDDTDDCEVTDDEGNVIGTGTSGNEEVTIDGTTTFTLECDDGAGTTEVIDTVTVELDNSDFNISANPKIIRRGGSVDLDWHTGANDPATCIITGPGVASSALSDVVGTLTGVKPQNDSTYTLSCDSGDEITTRVQVLPVLQEV